ncbi:hypothetical protein LINGRAHAP2_LOCUS8124 [Linum grandiflorum]
MVFIYIFVKDSTLVHQHVVLDMQFKELCSRQWGSASFSYLL